MQNIKKCDMVKIMTNSTATKEFLNLADAINVSKDTILTGKERGLAACEKLRVEQVYKDNDVVVIIVPENIIGISSSFINGFLASVVEESGGFDKFFPRLVVDASPRIVAGIIRDLRLGDLPPLNIGV